MPFLEDFSHKITSALQTLRVRSAVNPLLWLCALISFPIFSIGIVKGTLSWYLVITALLPIFAVLYAYFYFMRSNPDYLRSEEFQIQKKTLELIGEKGQEFPVTSSDLVEIARPEKNMLPYFPKTEESSQE
jgi:hypothetical protein